MSQILVLGSVNTDMVTRTPRFPLPGETLTAESFSTFFGGKGANQAIALGRLGADCFMAGLVGSDSFASEHRRHFREEGVNTDLLGCVSGSTGTASITVDASTGDNSILVVPGANGACDVEWFRSLLPGLGGFDMALLQLEIPHETVFEAIRALHAHGIKVMLDPAPAVELDDEWFRYIDYITPNETELSLLAPSLPFEQAMEKLHRLGTGTVIRKSGSLGAYVYDDAGLRLIRGYAVSAVDTTAAGDTFNAALAFALTRGDAIDDAVLFANAAAALSVTCAGAQDGMPTCESVTAFMAQNAPTA